MLKLFVSLCLVFLTHGHEENMALEFSQRVVNGDVISIAQAPYLVQLRHRNAVFCGGTILTDSHVLTAAHCFDARNPLETVVVAEANTASDIGVQRAISAYIKPPEYSKVSFNMDYMVLKLETPITGNLFRTLKLCSHPISSRRTMQVSGWGYTSQKGNASEELRTIQVETTSRLSCAIRHGFVDPQISNTMVCAFNSRQDVCFGDSGGAGVIDDEICAIVSWGRGCLVGLPSVYSNVYALRAKIEQDMRSLDSEVL